MLFQSKVRSELKNECRIQNLKFKRSMTPSQVKSVIIDGFRHIHGFSRFQYLENTSNSLSISPNQEFDGAAVVGRRGALYLCEMQVSIHYYVCWTCIA